MQPNVQYRSSSYETVRAMVAQEHGFSLLHQRPATDTTYAGGRVVAVPLADEVRPLRVVVATLQSMRRAGAPTCSPSAAAPWWPPASERGESRPSHPQMR